MQRLAYDLSLGITSDKQRLKRILEPYKPMSLVGMIIDLA